MTPFGARLLLSLGLASATLGCGTASGREWVRAPEPGGFDSDSDGFGPPAPAAEVSSLDEPAETGKPRLRRTVTLGESVVAAGAPREPASPSPAAAVVVTVNNYVTQTPSPSFVYGYGDAPAPFVRRAAAPRSAPALPAIGQDWPAPRDSGPPFPYKTAPASPWVGPR